MIAINIAIPSLAVHAVYLAIMFSGGCLLWQVRRILSDREWEASIRRRNAWHLSSPHLAPGEPWMVPQRVPTSSGMYNTRPFRGPYPTQERLAA